jgi:hypothetical protein
VASLAAAVLTVAALSAGSPDLAVVSALFAFLLGLAAVAGRSSRLGAVAALVGSGAAVLAMWAISGIR